ncbi:MAG: M48 family metallopeptidase [Candidatus Aminicenantales bacterium]
MKKMHPLLDEEKQKIARLYEREKRLLGFGGLLLSLIILLIFYYSGLSRRLAYDFIPNSIVLTFLAYVAVLYFLFSLLQFPLSLYASYFHEHKWNFSNQTFKAWLWDQAKSFLVGLVILNLILGLLLWILAFYPLIWWLVAGIGMAIVSVIFSIIFPVVILPIFNKYTPIEDKELTEALRKILARGGLKSSGFFKEDMSRQTKKENAFLAGLGKTRRVVLGDNLMNHMKIPEIESIIAHEVGHYKFQHIWKHICLGTLQQTIVFYLLNIAMRSFFSDFQSSTRENLTLIPILAILMGTISSFLFGPLGNAISRYFERQADTYALESIFDKKAFLTAMAGLANRNLSNAYPSKWIKWLYYSHPPIGERLETAEKRQA